ncbi:T9SS type A sorting domain-containing protein [Hymenobacter pini]|uniref:T9SS type A sorting domain-containing protein n=1 Tax=Hymenobacter pini TaxID=2880879 RepID=UPI001CF1FC03|nr:T9SS type A sorting domain-containing protein [Hymenobacter pini]MCA8830790.1 T9SS type A sorting domain-containing protein [Hymenobacter pini]
MKKLLLTLTAALSVSMAAQAQWVLQPFSFAPDGNLAQIDAVDDNTAWALSDPYFTGEYTNQVARTFDGGQNWTVLTVAQVDTATESIECLSAVSATTAWVATLSDVLGGRVLKTTNGGSTWTVQSTSTMFQGNRSYPNAIHFFNSNDGVVMGDPAETGQAMEIYYTSNGGTTWTRAANVPVGTANEFGTIALPAVAGNSIWIPNNKGDIFRSTDKGVTWTVSRKVASTEIETLAFRDTQNGLALISDQNSTNHLLYRSTDGGVTWSQLNYTGQLRGFALDNVPGTGNFISVGINFGNNDAGSSYSRDNGQTWTSIETSFNHFNIDAASATAVWTGAIGLNAAGDPVGLGAGKLTSTVLPTREATAVLGGSLAPNPSVGGVFRVQWPVVAHKGVLTLTVTDAVGREVLRRTLENTRTGEATLDLSHEKAGLYQVKLTSDAGVSHLRAQVL